MGARTSAAMILALELVKLGDSAYKAAKVTGVNASSITRTAVYKRIIAYRGALKNYT